VKEGAFREDLYWRLHVVVIELPPLRERPGDVPVLAEHFLARFAQAMNRRPLSLSPAAREALLAYPWPGNVRELQNAIERAVVVSSGDVVEPKDLPVRVTGTAGQTVPLSLAEAEKAHVLAMLEANAWNITRAAKALDVDRVTLYNKIRRYGFSRPGAEPEHAPEKETTRSE
jgi:DNA-binding NtrC family response regulator